MLEQQLVRPEAALIGQRQYFCLTTFPLPRHCLNFKLSLGPFKYYVSKEVGGWGQKMAIFADLQYYLC